MNSNDETRLEISRVLDASPAAVFAAWTNPETLSQWMAPGPMTAPVTEVDLKVGGRYRFEMKEPNGTLHTAVGVYEEIVPDQKLVFTWSWETGEGAALPETLVTVELKAEGNQTHLRLVHERFPAGTVRDEHDKGWGGILDKLPGALS